MPEVLYVTLTTVFFQNCLYYKYLYVNCNIDLNNECLCMVCI
jgi:hypothetical protein